MKEYTFETREINGKKEVVLSLPDFPDVQFKFKSIRFGDADEEHNVPVLFEIELIGENQTFPEDPEFGNQAARVLTDLLDKMLARKHEIANSIN